MNKAYFIICNLNKLKVTFCSKRLAEKMFYKSMQGEWITTYFRVRLSYLANVPNYTVYSVNSKGLVILVKE